jgi:hypothetical protein
MAAKLILAASFAVSLTLPAWGQTVCIRNLNERRSLPISDCRAPVLAPTTKAVSPAAYKQPTDLDDTASIQRALATCRTVQLSAKTYHVASTMYLCDGGHQRIVGFGRSSVIQISKGFSGATTCTDSVGNHWNAVFANPNCGSSSIADTHIEYLNFTLDDTVNIGKERSLIAIFNRSTQYVHIRGILCNSFADCTATLHSADTLIDDSVAINDVNAGFDAWDSPTNMTVSKTTVYCNPAAASYGLLYNSANTNASANGTATNFRAIGNKQFKCAPGIFIDPLTTNGLVREVNIIGNVEDNSNLTTHSNGGIAITGRVSGVTIRDAILRNMKNGQLYVGKSGVPNDTGIPDNVKIIGLHFMNVSNAGHSLLDLNGSNTNSAKGVNIIGGTYAYAYETDQTGTVIEGRFLAGTSGVGKTH